MADDWKVGDLAIIVRGNPAGANPSAGKPLDKRKVYRIEAVVPWGAITGLVLEGHYSLHPSRSYNSAAFRKIRPDEHEDCEPEFVELLNRIKRKVEA